MKQKILLSVLFILVLGSLVIAETQREEQEKRYVKTFSINALLDNTTMQRINSRAFVNMTSQDDDTTYITYYADITPEKENKIIAELSRFERQYNPLELPFYVKKNGVTYSCDIGQQNAIQCFTV